MVHIVSQPQKFCNSSLRQLWLKFCWIETQWCIIFNFTWSDQSHLDSHSDFTSTWLYPKTFHHWIKNSDSLAPKHSELLVSHRDSFKSEGHIYPYPISAILDSRVLQKWSCSVKCTPTYHPYAMPCHHTSWLRGQPTNMVYNNLHSIQLSSL